ncbi:MAG: hypothetical protein V4667_07590 [Bacteroidota bacterium]
MSNKSKISIKLIIGFIILAAVFTSIWYAYFSSPSLYDSMIEAANTLNKNCPVMIDTETRLDNTFAFEPNEFQYNYTLVNRIKDSIDLKYFNEKMRPLLVNHVKSEPDMKFIRDSRVIVIYHYKDKNGVFLTKIKITPNQYQEMPY